MSDYLFLMESRVSPAQWWVLLMVERAAADLGINLYLVGGAIRDLVAGSPIDDFDFVVEGSPSKLVKELKHRGVRVLSENSALQAVEVELAAGISGSVSMARAETFARSGAAPKIAPASIVTDLRRRDFPMNSIGISLSPNSRGLLLDPTNGLADIENRQIRAQHNYIFLDDPVRMFRAVRLRARLGFSWDPKLAAQFQTALDAGMPQLAAGEPLAHEMQQLALERNPATALRELDKEHLLQGLNPRLHGKAIDWPRFAKTAKAAQLLAQAGMRAPSFPLFLDLLIHKLSPKDRKSVHTRLKLGQAERNLPQKLDTEARKLAKEVGGRSGKVPAKLYGLLSNAPPDVLLLLMTNFPQAAIQARIKTYFTKYLPLRGSPPEKELEELGVKPGKPGYQKIIDAYFLASIEGQIRTPKQQQRYLAELAEKLR
jgi:tRNA nucleotidyltransferase/poly(A) polymerase